MSSTPWTPLSRPWTGQSQYAAHCTSPTATTAGSEYSYAMSRNHSSRRPSEAQTATPLKETPLVLNRDLWTRNLCIVGLILGWGAAIATTTVGSYIIGAGPVQVPTFLLDKAAFVGNVVFTWMALPEPQPYIADHRVYPVSQSAMIVIPLLLQIALTLIFSALNSIHSTTLRWTLHREGRLLHNSNPRLFTSTTRFGPNHWSSNTLSALGLILAYGSTTILTFPVSTVGTITIANNALSITPTPTPLYGLDFNAYGLLGLGIGLLLQSLLSTWCLLSRTPIPTWNANPLATARAIHILDPLPLRSKPSRSGHGTLPSPTTAFHHPFHVPTCTTLPTTTTFPSPSQPPLFQTLPRTRTLTNALWTITALLAIWMTTIAIVASTRGTANWAYVSQRSLRVDFLTSWQAFGEITSLYTDPFVSRREWIGLLIQCALLSVLIVGLQLAESVVQYVRDETIWRRMESVGVRPDMGIWVAETRCWECWVVAGYKCVVPWVFGFAVSCNTGVYMVLFPVVTLVGLFVVLGGWVEWLGRRGWRGTLPGCFGEVGVMRGVVDVWEERMFWGDKGGFGGWRVAGTAGRRLADLREGVAYVGLALERGR